MFTISSLLLVATAWAEPLAGEDPIVGAIHVDVTAEGLNALGAVVPAFAPADLAVEDVTEGVSGFRLEVSGIAVEVEFDDITITPNTGYLDINVDVLVAVNTDEDPFRLYTEALWLPSDCDAWVDPFPVKAHTTVAFELDESEEGPPVMDAVIGGFEVDINLTADETHIEGGFFGCAVGTTLRVLDALGLDLVSLIVGFLDGTLDSAIAEVIPELEATIEDAFDALIIEQSLELQDAELNLLAYPGAVDIKPSGMRVSLDGTAKTATADACIREWDDGTFDAVVAAPPDIGVPPEGFSTDYAGGILVSDDFGHQALYALWRSGLLCYVVDEDLGFPIDTSLLGLLAGDAFNELFPESKPMVIVTRPKKPPTMNLTSDHDVGLKVEELGLDFMGELDHRMARVLALDLEVDAGVDLNFDEEAGELGIAIDLGSDSITPTVIGNDFAPDSSETIETSFGSVFNGLVGGLLGDLLSDFNFSVPGFEGIGLVELQFASVGSEQDWLGGYAWLGEVTYASAGCSEDGSGGCADGGDGCADVEGSGCEGGGCTAAPRHQRRWVWLVFPAILISLRRRP